jgi:selT/selW/selH-like putative selenoprotein
VLKKELGVAARLEAGSGGVFDVWVDRRRVFSKDEEGDFPDEQDVVRRIKSL